MNAKTFIALYGKYAIAVEKTEGVPALFTLAQSALETGWGVTVIGNMMFGVKDTDGINGNEQLLTTTEYHSTATVKYPVVLWVKQMAAGRYQYKVKDWFRKYLSPEDSFRDHAKFLRSNKRYRPAFTFSDPYKFGKAVCDAGYATGPGYWESIEKIMKQIEPLVLQ